MKKGGARKKVRFLSEIMTRGQADGNDNGTAAQEVPVLPPIGNVQNVNASQVVPSVHGDVAAESGQIQFPPGFGTGRRLTIAEKGKTPVVHEDPIIEAV